MSESARSHSCRTIVARLLALGVTAEQILAHLRYIRPEVALTPAHRTLLEQSADGTTIALIDGTTEAMILHGLSLMDNEDVARWLALVPRVLADLGPAVLQIDHVVKNADNRGRYAIGSQHRLAGITGVAYKMLTIRSFGHGPKDTPSSSSTRTSTTTSAPTASPPPTSTSTPPTPPAPSTPGSAAARSHTTTRATSGPPS